MTKMRYITKSTNGLFEIHEETLMASILSDIISFMVIAGIGAMYCFFAVYVGRSWIFELAIVVIVVLYLYNEIFSTGKTTKDLTKEQLIEQLQKELKP